MVFLEFSVNVRSQPIQMELAIHACNYNGYKFHNTKKEKVTVSQIQIYFYGKMYHYCFQFNSFKPSVAWPTLKNGLSPKEILKLTRPPGSKSKIFPCLYWRSIFLWEVAVLVQVKEHYSIIKHCAVPVNGTKSSLFLR